MKSIHDPEYIKAINHLRKIRKAGNISQVELSEKLGQPQSYVAKVENLERRLDIYELYKWLRALEYRITDYLDEVGWG